MTNEEWKRLKAAYEEAGEAFRGAKEALVLPKGTRVRHKNGGKGVVAAEGSGYVSVRLPDDRAVGWYWRDLEVIDPPKWLKVGSVVDFGGAPALVSDVHTDGSVNVRLHNGGFSCLNDPKPYVPKFEPGDRVMLATTGDVGEVVGGLPLSGLSEVRFSSGSTYTVSAHLLTNLED